MILPLYKRSRKYILTFIKLFTAIGLSAYIFFNVDLESFRSVILNTNSWVLLIVFFCMLLNIVISAKKWQILLRIHNIYYHITILTKYYLIGGFFSNFLPSTIGGDSYRIFKTLQNSTSKSGSVLSVFVERIFGLIVLLFIGSIASIISYSYFGDQISTLGILFGASGFLSLSTIILMLSSNKLRNYLFEQPRVPEKFKLFLSHIDDYRQNFGKFSYFIGVSVGYYLLLFAYRYGLIRSFGESCPIFSLAMIIMISNVIATLPISINGIGVLDGSFILLVGAFGVSYETALMTMVSQRLLAVIVSLIGGILFYFFDKDRHLPEIVPSPNDQQPTNPVQ